MTFINQFGQQEDTTDPIIRETTSQVQLNIRQCTARLLQAKRLGAETAAVFKELKEQAAQAQEVTPDCLQSLPRPRS